MFLKSNVNPHVFVMEQMNVLTEYELVNQLVQICLVCRSLLLIPVVLQGLELL